MGTDSNEPGTQPGSRHRDAEHAGLSSREDWTALPSDPDLHQEFGYRTIEWEVITPADDTDQLIFLPSEEEILKEDAFVIADEDAVCDLHTHH